MDKNNSYEKRVVSYEKIHSIEEKDFEALVSIVKPQNGETILDACCGYGSVSKNLTQAIKKNNLDTKIVLLDSSELQIQRAKENLNEQDFEFVHSDAINTPFPDNHFDTIVNKMGLHEVNKQNQEGMLREFYRILKPNGKMVIWELALDDKTQPLFSKVIKEKDRLAGFDSLERNRYFPKKEETISLLGEVGFKDAKVEHNVSPRLSIRNRKEEFVSADRLKILEEKGFIEESDEIELEKLAEEKIQQLRNFIKENLTEEDKILFGYEETENDTKWNVSKAIFKAIKPE